MIARYDCWDDPPGMIARYDEPGMIARYDPRLVRYDCQDFGGRGFEASASNPRSIDEAWLTSRARLSRLRSSRVWTPAARYFSRSSSKANITIKKQEQ